MEVEHGIQPLDDTVNAMNEAILPSESTLVNIKCFLFECDMSCTKSKNTLLCILVPLLLKYENMIKQLLKAMKAFKHCTQFRN